MRLGTVLCLTSLAAALLIGAAAAAGDVSDEQAKSKALFEERCSICHGIDRPLSKNKTKEEWQATVKRMRENFKKLKVRGTITEEEAKRIVDYLATVRGQK